MSPTRPTAARAPDARPASRRRVSRRRYALRRLVALAVIGGAVIGGTKVVTSVVGSDDEAEASPTAPGSTELATSTSVAPAVTAPGGADSVAPTTTAEPDAPAGPPSAASPATVLIAGDSDAGTFGPYLEQLLDETGVVETVLDYKVSSGLARPDFFDWPAELRSIIPDVEPDIVVVTFGGNDAQFLADASGAVVAREPSPESDNAEWRAEYERRVGEVMDFLAQDGRTVIWVGIPNDDNPDVTFRMQVQDEAAKAAAAARPDVVFVDTWQRFSGRNGGWAEYVIDPRDGQGKDVRADDGFHLNETGAEILALDIAEHVRTALRDLGAAL
jgi:hypothetical protein